MGLRAFFDGSNSGGGWRTANFITLASFAVDDSVLSAFNDDWKRVLTGDGSRPAVDYIHMKELRKGSGNFANDKGWTDELRGRLVVELLMYLQHLDKKRTMIFVVSVDCAAHRRLVASGYPLIPYLELCNYFCSKRVLGWYTSPQYPGLTSGAEFIFDRSEPFRHHFETLCRSKKRGDPGMSGHTAHWQMVTSIRESDIAQSPALQVADMVAWGRNRQICADEGDFMKHLHKLFDAVVPSLQSHFNEDALKIYGRN